MSVPLAAAAAGALVRGPGVGAAAVPQMRVVVDGRTVTLSPAPVLIGGRPYVSVEAIAELLGVPASWDARSDTLTVGSAGDATHAFTYEGIRYAVTGLQARIYPEPQTNSGVYWIVQYSVVNTTSQSVDVQSTQPSLVLLGPRGAQYTSAASVSGAMVGTLNPGIAFASYAVFNVPAGVSPGACALGFATFGAYSGSPAGAALVPSSARTSTTRVDATYTVSNLWNEDAQQVLIRQVVRSTTVLPDLSASSFDPTTSFWIVDCAIDNPGSQAIALESADFALQFAGGAAIAPYPVARLKGYMSASGLYSLSPAPASTGSSTSNSPNGNGSLPTPLTVTLPPGRVWTGQLLFEVPGTISTKGPGLAVSANGQTRAVSIEPCSGGCPPVQD